MGSALDEYRTFEAVKERLDKIVAAVSDESLPLDDALDLYEEAVSLGLRASDLLETDIDADAAAEALAQEEDCDSEREVSAADAEAQSARGASESVQAALIAEGRVDTGDDAVRLATAGGVAAGGGDAGDGR